MYRRWFINRLIKEFEKQKEAVEKTSGKPVQTQAGPSPFSSRAKKF